MPRTSLPRCFIPSELPIGLVDERTKRNKYYKKKKKKENRVSIAVRLLNLLFQCRCYFH